MSYKNIPAHVPPGLVRDIDVFNIQAFDPDLHVAFKIVQDANPPLFFSPHHGGHWLPTRADLIERIFSDAEAFSSHNAAVPPAPEGTSRALPLHADGSEHRVFRSFITPHLIGKPLRIAIDKARLLAVELIEGFLSKGQCEFIGDFAQHLPIHVFLSIVDLPSEDRTFLLELADIVRTPLPEERGRLLGKLAAYISACIEKRLEHPGDDMISRIVMGQFEGRPLTREEMIGTCTVVLLGGLDTVASTMGFIAAHLANHAELRHQLAAEPALIEKNIDEIIRRFGVAGPSRVVAKDIELDGVHMKAGDRIFLAAAFHGVDERRWPNPLEVDLSKTKPATAYQTFGSGPHRCPGAGLARSEVILFLEEWLKRIPDFKIVEGSPMIAGSGNTNGLYSLQLEWDVAP